LKHKINLKYTYLPILFNIFSIISLILTNCYDKGKISTSMVYWSSNNPYEIEYAKTIINRWNELHPEHLINYQPVPEGRSSEEIILAAVVGKTTPDIYSNMWQGDVEAYAQAGILIPLDTIPGFINFLEERCDSQTVAEVTAGDGHIYQIPWKINPIMMVYNVKLLQSIGYNDPPSTYSEFLDAAEKFKKDTDGDGYIDRWIGYSEVVNLWYQRFFDFYALYIAASESGRLIDEDSVVFNNDYAVQVFDFLQKLYLNNYFPKERLSARSDAFLSSDIATRFTGPWTITQYERLKPEGFEYAFHHLPVPDNFTGNIYTYGDPKNIVIFNTCKNPPQACGFLIYMLNLENDYLFLKITQQLPRRKNLFQSPQFVKYFEANPKIIPFAKQASYVRGTDLSENLKEVFDIISQEYEACVIYGVKTPEKAVTDAAKAAQLLSK
jgi:multiple sugar transport system substrate-binding protein